MLTIHVKETDGKLCGYTAFDMKMDFAAGLAETKAEIEFGENTTVLYDVGGRQVQDAIKSVAIDRYLASLSSDAALQHFIQRKWRELIE